MSRRRSLGESCKTIRLQPIADLKNACLRFLYLCFPVMEIIPFFHWTLSTISHLFSRLLMMTSYKRNCKAWKLSWWYEGLAWFWFLHPGISRQYCCGATDAITRPIAVAGGINMSLTLYPEDYLCMVMFLITNLFLCCDMQHRWKSSLAEICCIGVHSIAEDCNCWKI